MVVAIYTHLRRKEYGNIFINVILLLAAVFVAYGRILVLPEWREARRHLVVCGDGTIEFVDSAS